MAELERVRRELRQSEARFRDVIERNADAILVLDRIGTVRFANSAAERLFGNPPDGLPGTSFGYPCVAGETSELDIARDGTTHVVEMRVVDSAWEGEPACIASLRDITERKRAEEAARRLFHEQAARTAAEDTARRFRFLAESGTVLSSTLDPAKTMDALADLCVSEIADWAIIYCIEDDDIISRSAVAYRRPEHAEQAGRLRARPLASTDNPLFTAVRAGTSLLLRSVSDEELASITEDATHAEQLRSLGLTSFMLVPLHAHQRCIGAIALARTQGERRFDAADLAFAEDLALRAALAVDNARLYRIARAANQAKSDYLAVISHDLRTPLNSIIGHADLLSMGIPEQLSAATMERVERIRTSAAHLLRLIDELLTWVRLDTGHEECSIERADATAVARDVASVVELLASERDLDFEVDIPKESVPLETDAAKLHQVLLNLVANAIKYTERGSVRLSLEAGGNQVRFVVADTGIGIAAEHLPKIFEPFWQVDRTRVTDGGGTGLGLSVVQRLVHLLGGEVSVQSEQGKGSTFVVVLPA